MPRKRSRLSRSPSPSPPRTSTAIACGFASPTNPTTASFTRRFILTSSRTIAWLISRISLSSNTAKIPITAINTSKPTGPWTPVSWQWLMMELSMSTTRAWSFAVAWVTCTSITVWQSSVQMAPGNKFLTLLTRKIFTSISATALSTPPVTTSAAPTTGCASMTWT